MDPIKTEIVSTQKVDFSANHWNTVLTTDGVACLMEKRLVVYIFKG